MNDLALEQGIKTVDSLAKAGNIGEATLLSEQLAKRFPGDCKVWSLSGYLHELSGDYAQAVADLTLAIAIDALEPEFFYSRGRYNFHMNERNAAIQDFSDALQLCDLHKNNYYQSELLFWRAEALIAVGRKQEAALDLALLDDSFASWTYELRTKEALLQECLA